MIEITIKIKQGGERMAISYYHHLTEPTELEKREAAVFLSLVKLRAQMFGNAAAEDKSEFAIVEGPSAQVGNRISHMFDNLDKEKE